MKLGRIPTLVEFKHYGSIDPLKLISKFDSYHNFLKAKDKDYNVQLSESEEKLLEYFSKIAAPGKRYLEIEMLELLESNDNDPISALYDKYHDLNQNALDNITAVFNGTFYKNSPAILDKEGKLDPKYRENKSLEYHRSVKEIIELGKYNHDHDYQDIYSNTNFVLNKMYTYDDVCRLMNWDHNINAINIGGYKFDQKTNTFCVFINYVKDEKVVESQRYEDHFENRNTLIALSKSLENKDSKNMVRVRDHKANRTDIHLFIRKNKDDEGSKEFYYLGKMDFDSFVNDETPVKIKYKLREEVRFDLFEYFIR